MNEQQNNNNSKQLAWKVARALSVESLGHVEVLSMTHDTVTIKCFESLDADERLSFDSDTAHTPPVLTEVVSCEGDQQNGYIAHCKCLMGAFDVPNNRRA